MKNNFTTGIILGAALGAVIGAAGSPIRDKQRRMMRSKTTRAIKTISNIVDGFIND